MFKPKFVLFFFNLCGILQLSYENHQFKVSRVVTLITILKFPTIILIMFFITFTPNFLVKLYGQDKTIFDDFSVIAKVVLFLTTSTYMFLAFFLSIVQTYKREQTMKFFNFCLNIRGGPNNGEQFLSTSFLSCTFLLFFFVAEIFLQIIFTMKLTFFSLIFCTLHMIPYLTIIGLVAVVKHFEFFFVSSLETLENDLSEFQRHNKIGTKTFEVLL